MRRSLHPPSPALVVACLALGVSLGGVGYAATMLPRASVGTAQLKKNAVTSVKVKNRALLAVDFKLGQLPAGAPGAKGDKGDKGAPGATTVTVRSANQTVNANDFKTGEVSCASGERATGGGMRATNLNYPFYAMRASNPLPVDAATPTGWEATVYSTQSGTFRVYVVCAAP
jgi:hypothetical protein